MPTTNATPDPDIFIPGEDPIIPPAPVDPVEVPLPDPTDDKCISEVNIPKVDNSTMECDEFTSSKCVVVEKECKKVGNLPGESLDTFVGKLCTKLELMDRKIVLASNSGGGTTSETSIPDWVEGTHPVGKIVAHNGGIWRSEVAGNVSEPVQVTTSSWEKTEIEPVDYYIDYLVTGDEGFSTNILYELEQLPNLNITKNATPISTNLQHYVVTSHTILEGQRVINRVQDLFMILIALEDIPAGTDIAYLMNNPQSPFNPAPDLKFKLNTVAMTSSLLVGTCDQILAAVNSYGDLGIQVVALGEEGEYLIKSCPLDDRTINYNNEDIQVFDFTSADITSDWKLLSEVNKSTDAVIGDYIPLSGTEEGKPITGDIEFISNESIALKQANNKLEFSEIGVGIKSNNIKLSTEQLGPPNLIEIGDQMGRINIQSNAGGIKLYGPFINIESYSYITIGNNVEGSKPTISVDSSNFLLNVDSTINITADNISANSKSVYFTSETSSLNLTTGSGAFISSSQMIMLNVANNSFYIPQSTNDTRFSLPADKETGNYILSTTQDNSYSINEIKTGATWINGKPIYTITQLTANAIPADMETRFPDEVVGDYTVYKYTKTTL